MFNKNTKNATKQTIFISPDNSDMNISIDIEWSQQKIGIILLNTSAIVAPMCTGYLCLLTNIHFSI